jgi:L-lactate dehydrogenase complex protein LldG
MSTAKQEILARIRGALRDVQCSRADEYTTIPRSYVQSTSEALDQRLGLFIHRLHDYDATVYSCAPKHVSETIAEALIAREKKSILVPVGLPDEWLPTHFDYVVDRGLTYEEINAMEGVITGSALAIAFTGTIVLRHSAEEGRRALTLIPDYHLCVVQGRDVVQTVPEAIRKMALFGSSPVTTIAGPSATADIEMTRIKGVHGPRTLDVVLVVD